jgi:3-phenylpropionate/trans-cinnamate dioxygenase ferredoxin subunit
MSVVSSSAAPPADSTGWVDVAPAAEFLPGTCRTVDLEGIPVAIFNVNGTYHAIEDVCTHETETLSEGVWEGEEITCPRHAARFSLVTGEALSPPAYEAVLTFSVRVSEGTVQVRDTRQA